MMRYEATLRGVAEAALALAAAPLKHSYHQKLRSFKDSLYNNLILQPL